MRVRTLTKVTRDWIDSAMFLHGVDNLPREAMTRIRKSSIANLHLKNPRQARKRVFDLVADCAEPKKEDIWSILVSPHRN